MMLWLTASFGQPYLCTSLLARTSSDCPSGLQISHNIMSRLNEEKWRRLPQSVHPSLIREKR